MTLKSITYLLVFVFFFSCSSEKKEPAKAEAPEVEEIAPKAESTDREKYPPSISKPFLDGCVYGMSVWLGPEMATTVCACSWSEIENKYSLAEFVELSAKVSEDFIPKDVQSLVEGCLKVNSKKSVSLTDKVDDPGQEGRYPETVRKRWLTDCVKSATEDGADETKSNSYCECALVAFESKYDIGQFLGLLSENEKEKSQKFMSVIEQCLPNLTDDEPRGTAGSDGFPERLSSPFTEACLGFFKEQLGEAVAGRTCSCTLKKVEQFYSLEEFIKIIPKMDGGDFPQELEAMFVSCVASTTKR